MNQEMVAKPNELGLWECPVTLQEIKEIYAPKASNSEFKALVQLGKATTLNPFLREIWIVKYGDNPAQIFIGRDGYRRSAQANHDYDYHHVEAVYSNDDLNYDVIKGEVNHKQDFKNRGNLVGAYCVVKRKNSSKPVYVFTDLKEYSTGKSLWATKPATMIKKCFDSETEVLTDKGFQRFDSVTANILEVTDNGLNAADSKPFSQQYSGEMIQYDGQYLNFSVTPNHTMITLNGKIDAEELFNKSTKCYRDAEKIPSSITFDQDDYPISDDKIMLAAYFLADGSYTGFRQFRIAVSRGYKISALEKLNLHTKLSIKNDKGRLSSHGSRIIETKKDKNSYTFSMHLIEEICDGNKFINMEVINYFSQRQIKLLVDSLILFDGVITSSNKKIFYTSNIELLKSFELIAILAGYTISVPTLRSSDIGKKQAYAVTVSEKKFFNVVTYMEKKQGIKKVKNNSSNEVWCVTVPSGKIIVRRHGFSMVCGNCAEAQCLRMTFQELFGGSYAPEELPEDMHYEKNITPPHIPDNARLEGTALSHNQKMDEEVLEEYLNSMDISLTKEGLQTIYIEAKQAAKGDKIALNKISIATRKRLSELTKTPTASEAIAEIITPEDVQKHKDSRETFYAEWDQTEVKS